MKWKNIIYNIKKLHNWIRRIASLDNETICGTYAEPLTINMSIMQGTFPNEKNIAG